MTLIVDGKPWEPILDENPAYYIEYWYDRHQQYWVIQVFNEHTDAEEHCEVGIQRDFLQATIDAYKVEYNTTDVRHK